MYLDYIIHGHVEVLQLFQFMQILCENSRPDTDFKNLSE